MEIGKIIIAALIVAGAVVLPPRVETGGSVDVTISRDVIARVIRMPYDNRLPEAAANQFKSEAVIFDRVPGTEMAFASGAGPCPIIHHGPAPTPKVGARGV